MKYRTSTRPAHREPGGAVTLARGAVARASVHAQTRLQAAVAVEALSAGLVAVKPRPPRLARALALHWVTAGQSRVT